MPAVLVEIGFGTNAEEARFLNESGEAARDRERDRERRERISRQLRAQARQHRSVTRRAPRCRRRGDPLSESRSARLRNRCLRARDRRRHRSRGARRHRHESRERAAAERRAAAARGRHAGRDAQRDRARESGRRRSVRANDLPWLAANLSRARVLVNVVGDTVEDYPAVITQLDGARRHRWLRAERELPEHEGGRPRVRRRSARARGGGARRARGDAAAAVREAESHRWPTLRAPRRSPSMRARTRSRS